MQEDFLHFIWKHKKFSISSLKTTDGEELFIKSLGRHNLNSGPDFFNAQLTIANQLWAGNVEIHIKSSDWYVHNHENDMAYDNVILHVVWEHDTEIFRKDNSVIPTLELKHYVNADVQSNYEKLVHSKAWINCESDFSKVSDFLVANWLERLFVERLERKSQDIVQLLNDSNNDWEAVLFKLLLKNFGLKLNGEPFLSLANSIDFSIFRKHQNNLLELESLLFGQSNMLKEDIQESYFTELTNVYNYLKIKYKIKNHGVLPINFFRLRPPNFPTIRLSQFANLYHKELHLFSKIISLSKLEDFYDLFSIGVSDFWRTHYTFSKSSKSTPKKLTKSFVNLLIINTIIPLKFSYAKSHGKSVDEELFALMEAINIENNSIVNKFLDLRPFKKNAMVSQSLLQLKNSYCDRNRCLQCAIGNSLIAKK